MDIPELTSFASLVRFALRLEERAAAHYTRLTASSAGSIDLAAQHRARGEQIQRARQQFLNEVVLEPISGLNGRSYLAAIDESGDSAGLDRAILLEETAARFYEDSANAAEPVLVEASRVFRRLAVGNRANVERLRKGAP